MVFTSAFFLFLFFPVVLIGYYFINPKLRNFWLFFCSLWFYAWSGVYYTIILLISTVMNYIFGVLLSRLKCRKKVLVCSIIYNLSVLCFFKYYAFILFNVQKVFQLFIPTFNVKIPTITLPIGISFFTFQIMSYIIDLYRGEIKVQKSFINLGLYIFLFPQMIAGPIVRYINIEREIYERKSVTKEIDEGLKRFITGLGKKVIIANTMGSWANYVFNLSNNNLNTPVAWLGIFSYTLQIYFDFSGYSDMAIGLGKIFGFHFLENFNYPYISESIQEFWKRWHISLSQWFKDYLYIPLGGNRKGKMRTYINSFIVFFLTGLWHGASWNFIFWGLFHGTFLIVEKTKFKNLLKKIPKFFRHIYTLMIIMIGWVFFRIEGFFNALKYLKRLFIFDFNNLEYFYLVLDIWKIIILIFAVLFCFPSISIIKKNIIRKKIKNGIMYEIMADTIYLILFLLSICFIFASDFNPFLYFRF